MGSQCIPVKFSLKILINSICRSHYRIVMSWLKAWITCIFFRFRKHVNSFMPFWYIRSCWWTIYRASDLKLGSQSLLPRVVQLPQILPGILNLNPFAKHLLVKNVSRISASLHRHLFKYLHPHCILATKFWNVIRLILISSKVYILFNDHLLCYIDPCLCA